MRPVDRRLRIDLVVQGRFFAFDLVKALTMRGHDVRLLTNYPKMIVSRFGIPPEHVRSCLWHGIAVRAYARIHTLLKVLDWDAWLHQIFSRWASRHMRAEADAVIAFSGVAEELFQMSEQIGTCKRVLIRASAHIREQHQLLTEEQVRSGHLVEKPSLWKMEREEREYSMADAVVVLSAFAYQSFERAGLGSKTKMIGLAAPVEKFRPAIAVANARQARIAQGALRVIMVGSLTPRKGAMDFVSIASQLHGTMEFRFVGDLPPPGSDLEKNASSVAELVSRVPEHKLPMHYAWADIFCFPTIEDGSPVVIAQALASGLPVLATTNCSAPDLIVDGQNGWVLPIRAPEAFVDRLRWCHTHRHALGRMAHDLMMVRPKRAWDDVARDFEDLIDG